MIDNVLPVSVVRIPNKKMQHENFIRVLEFDLQELVMRMKSEGPEKATRGGGVNGSQLKFLPGTLSISQTKPGAPLF
jgi:hypothetical protein